MLQIENLSENQLQNVRIACAYLFSAELGRDDEFVTNLDLASVNKALEKKTKQYDPELHPDESAEMIQKRKERFIKIKQSYETLIPYIYEKEEIIAEPDFRKSRIIAVGGAKGGIGKSIFASNLGVYLSSLGKRTVLVDLDLGGANLHLYLGESFLKYNINDFLNKNVPSIDDIMVSTKYGPDLVGGGSSQLGSANIHFSQKLKLLRAIKQIDADYVIIDLGGDTSYNIIDFFLAADQGIVLTTCDPSSYLDAYNLIKVALYRKLNRMFGPESELRKHKDPDLLWLIKEATIPGNGNKLKGIGDLIESVKNQLPERMSLIEHVLESFRPGLVVNMISPNDHVAEVVNRIQDVSQKMLTVAVDYLGSIDYQPDIKKSAQDLVPVISRDPKGNLAESIGEVVSAIVC
ncbi:MAG: AAA family ATPase [Thermodesulfobacteriota bacterium]|nr:AAA family ATPase [Thermodesulfobacteriota bacterium]